MSLRLSFRQSQLLVLIVVWNIGGFPILAATTSLLSFQSTGISITVRAIVAFLSLWLIATHLKKRFDLPLLLFSIFWTAYFVRLIVSLGIKNGSTSNDPSHYWIWALGVCALPALAVLLATRRTQAIDIFLPLAAACGLAALLVYVAIAGPFSVATDQWADRQALENLNPISVGNVGASALLCGFMGLDKARKALLHRLLFAALIVLGVLLVVLANSRGPVVGAAIASLVYLYSKTRTWSGLLVLILVVLAVIGTLFFVQDKVFGDGGLAARFSTIAPDGDLSSIQRFIALSGALDQFWGSPIFGDGVEEKITQFYPHNLIVEAFMATGLIGGVPFLVLFVTGVVRAMRLTLGAGPNALVGMLAIQQAVAVQFSGALYASGGFWVFLCLAIALERQMPRYRPVLQQQRSQYIHTGRD